MDKELYDLMDWAGIEEIVYSEAAYPQRLLGPQVTEAGLLVQVFIPTAVMIVAKVTATGKEYPMEQVDEAGYFAVLIPRKSMTGYTLLVTYDNGTSEEIHDPYSFKTQYKESDVKKFIAGIHYSIYDKMGAHPAAIDGVEGVYFSVWAPCAMRVSVVGDFNLWDGRRHQMRKLDEESGIFELFIPGLKAGTIYKYEIKHQNGDPQLKSDPYANFAELRPNNASVVWDIGGYTWQDQAWMEARAKTDTKERPMSIYEVHLGSWLRKETAFDEQGEEIAGSEFYNYREIAAKLAEYAKDMGYTHVELMPVMEHPLDASWGYQVSGYYAPTSRYGTPDDFMYFMDYMHGQGIGVILDWVPAHFPRDSFGLACFDGTCVYEHKDPRQGSHPHWGTLIYNYGRPGVCNFLIANALFWADKYHADGIRMDAVASMLYLDYGKNPGEWIPNIYGGHENLEAVDFLKHLNSVFKGRKDGAMLIAEESTAWPQITGDVKDGAVGFDYKWNMGWMNDFLGYMQCDPYFRRHHYGELTFSMIYAYSEDFILVFSHDEVVHGKASMIRKMPGDTPALKAANLRAAYGFMMGHPGKKLLFMGQDFAQMDEWNEDTSLQWNLLELPFHKQTQDYVKALNRLYREYPALYQMDYDPDGFEWVNCTDAEESVVVFLRKTKKPEETLLFICNFDTVGHEKFQTGVPFAGKYKEILNSDAGAFGGEGRTNPRVKTSKKAECDERPDSIVVTLPPLCVLAFECTPVKDAGKTAPKGSKEAVKRGKSTAQTVKAVKTGGKTKKAAKQPAGNSVTSAASRSAGKSVTSPASRSAGKSVASAASRSAGKSVASAASKPAGKSAAAEQPAIKSGAVEKITDKKPVVQRIEDKKPVTHKIADKRPVAEKIEDKKAVVEKLEDKKPATGKIEDKKPKAEKLEDKKPATGKIEDKKPKTEKLEDKKPATEKIEDKKPKTEKLEDKKPETGKIEDKKPKTEKLEDKKPATGKIEDKKPKTEKLEDKKPETEKIEDKKPKTEKLEDKKPATGKIEDKQPKTEKLEDKKPATEKIEDKKPKTEKLEDKKPATEKIEDKKPKTEKPKTEKPEDKRPAAGKIEGKSLKSPQPEAKPQTAAGTADKQPKAGKPADRKTRSKKSKK